MNSSDSIPLGYSDGDVDTNPSDNPAFDAIVAARYSRRQTMFGGVAALATATMATSLLAACSDNEQVALVVNAGEDARATSGRVVTLSGAGDMAGGSAAWSQVSGPAVDLANADTATTSFIAPGVTDRTALIFRFTITDAGGRTASDESRITVDPARLGFDAVPKSLLDRVVVPEGYSVAILYGLGDPERAFRFGLERLLDGLEALIARKAGVPAAGPAGVFR